MKEIILLLLPYYNITQIFYCYIEFPLQYKNIIIIKKFLIIQ